MPETAVINAKHLRRAMELTGFTSGRLACEVNISRPYASDICAGRRSVARDRQLRCRIAEVLNVPLEWIEK